MGGRIVGRVNSGHHFLPNTEGTFSESIGQIMFGSAFMILGRHTLRVAHRP
jgi:hypothetical protein